MQSPSRTFEFRKAVRERTPLIIGMAGPSGSGKTYSALRLAKGMVNVLGGRIAVVDTEARRALHYSDQFDFDHVDFEPPFGPLDYMAAIDTAVERGASVIIVDSASHEHSGEGGVMDQIDRWLDGKCGDDYEKREKLNMVAHARIKPQRKKLNNHIVQIGRTGVVLILCYRAVDKSKPITGHGIKHVGFTPETTSPLVYEMTQCYLLAPGAEGKPTTNPDTNEEKVLTKTPMQFKGWMTGQQIDEALGEKLARWAAGGTQPTHTASKPAPSQPSQTSQAPARLETTSVPLAPKCPKCGGGMKLVAAGISKAGKPYSAFYGCKDRNCRGSAKVPEPAAAIEEVDPPSDFELGRDYPREHIDDDVTF